MKTCAGYRGVVVVNGVYALAAVVLKTAVFVELARGEYSILPLFL